MTKFRTDVTKGGYKILSLHGPDGCDEYAGVVDTGGSYLTITWYDTGVPVSANDLYSLIQLDEPKPDHKIEARLEALEERLQTLEACSDETMSILQKELKIVKSRLEALEHDNKESNTWGVRVNGDLQELHNRILRLERKTADTSDYHNLRLQIQDVEKQLEALKQRTKTDEKGVWVTTKTFWDACWSQVSVKGEPLEDLFERMAKQLGLE